MHHTELLVVVSDVLATCLDSCDFDSFPTSELTVQSPWAEFGEGDRGNMPTGGQGHKSCVLLP